MKSFKTVIGSFAFLAALTASFGASAEPLTVNPKAQRVQFDLQTFNEWRDHVHRKDLSEEELIQSYSEFISSTVFEGLRGAMFDRQTYGDVILGKMSDDEFYIITKAVSQTVQNVDKAFPIWPFQTSAGRRAAGVCNAIVCLNDFHLPGLSSKNNSPTECLEKITFFHPLAGEKTQTKVYQSLVIFYRTGKFFESFINRNDFLAYASRNPSEVATLRKFIRQYMTDLFCDADYTGAFWMKF